MGRRINKSPLHPHCAAGQAHGKRMGAKLKMQQNSKNKESKIDMWAKGGNNKKLGVCGDFSHILNQLNSLPGSLCSPQS